MPSLDQGGDQRGEVRQAHRRCIDPIWSGSTREKVRMNKLGNRQLNAALHGIAVTQLGPGALGEPYYDKCLAANDSKTEALRRLKRHLVGVVYNTPKISHLPAAAPA